MSLQIHIILLLFHIISSLQCYSVREKLKKSSN